MPNVGGIYYSRPALRQRGAPTRYLCPWLVSILLISIVHAQGKQEPIRVCVSILKNSSLEFVNPRLQRDELIKAFERINKSKDVKKGRTDTGNTTRINRGA